MLPLQDNETRIELTLNNKASTDDIFTDFEKNVETQVLFCKYVDEIKIRGITYKPELKIGEKNKIGVFKGKKGNYLRFRLN